MENVTRDVISDIWPLYNSGEASPATRSLVEEFLREDPEFAKTLREIQQRIPSAEAPKLTPDHELKTLARVRKRLAGPLLYLNLAIMSSCFAFGRLVSDTSFDVSPRKFIAAAVVALVFWVVFLIKLYRGRRAILLQVRR
jgi:hypothetical protein